MKRIIFIIIVISIVVGLASYFAQFFDENIDITPSDKSNMIVVATPIKDSEISSPLSVSGRARGNWFFEASFPITLVDSYNNVISESHVTAQGDWMTKDFVKFVGVLEFSNYIKGSKGKLILRKDNPSGLPEHNDSVEIPIIFK